MDSKQKSKSVRISSLEELVNSLKLFCNTNSTAVQLDGSAKPRSNRAVMIHYTHPIDDVAYTFAIPGDTKKSAIERLISLFEEDPKSVFIVDRTEAGGNLALRLRDCRQDKNGRFKPDGWFCYYQTAKSKSAA